MRIYFWVLIIAAVALKVSGKADAIVDYGTLAVNHLSKSLESSIPLAVSLERLKLSIAQLDHQIAGNSQRIAQESVAIDRFAADVESKAKGIEETKLELSGLKSKFVCADCDQTKELLKASMAKHVTRYQSQVEASGSMQAALDRRRESFEKLVALLDQQKATRQVLQAKYESLKADYTSMQMRGQLSGNELDSSGVRKAIDLANDIADRLEVQRRMNTYNSDALVSATDIQPADLDMAAVESIIGRNETIATN